MGKTDRDAVEQLEQRYGITISEHHRKLLVTVKDLLSPIERQEKFLLGIAVAPVNCPACLSEICELSAHEGELDFKAHSSESVYRCPLCTARLEWQVPFVGSPFFTVHPESARKPVARD